MLNSNLRSQEQKINQNQNQNKKKNRDKLSLLYIITTTSQKTNNNTSNKSQGKYQVRITRELNKESLMYCYPIYTIDTWSMLAINNSILMFICQP